MTKIEKTKIEKIIKIALEMGVSLKACEEVGLDTIVAHCGNTLDSIRDYFAEGFDTDYDLIGR